MIKASNVYEFKILQYMKKYLEVEKFMLEAGEHVEGQEVTTYIRAEDKKGQRIYFYIKDRVIKYAEDLKDIE